MKIVLTIDEVKTVLCQEYIAKSCKFLIKDSTTGKEIEIEEFCDTIRVELELIVEAHKMVAAVTGEEREREINLIDGT